VKKLALGLFLIAAMGLGACSQQSAQSSLEPSYSSCNPLSSTLQFYAGTANVAGVTGLNTVVTLRQNAAPSCTAGASLLVNAPTITGPAGFAVPASADIAGNTDAGTAKISGNIVTSLLAPPPVTTFDNSTTGFGLATGYGFMPSVQQSSLSGPSYSPYALPFYVATAGKLSYIGGPPAFIPPADAGGVHTSTRDGTFPGGYLGYVLGFVDFQAPPVAGAYALSVSIPTGQNLNNGTSSYGTETASSSITHVAPLATWAVAPTFVSDGTGGGTITTGFAGGAGLTEEYIELVDNGPGTAGSACTTAPLSVSYPIYYTFKVAPGAVNVTVPDNIGPAQPGKTQGHTLCTAADNGGGAGPGGDAVTVYGFAVDYSLLSTAYPASNGNPAPTFTLNAGQADVTTSPSNATATE
jgi:hypothetical protein